MRPSFAAAFAALAVAGLAAEAVVSSSFLGAPAGTPLPFARVVLPPLAAPPASGGPGTVALAKRDCPSAPTAPELLSGETVITTAAEMKSVWSLLFAVPYDPSLFDFQSDFVVLMGSGFLQPGASFDISAVEGVQASYANFGGLGGDTAPEDFLSVTSTTFLPGVQPADPPPGGSHVSAVRISKLVLDDVVFHRALIAGV